MIESITLKNSHDISMTVAPQRNSSNGTIMMTVMKPAVNSKDNYAIQVLLSPKQRDELIQALKAL